MEKVKFADAIRKAWMLLTARKKYYITYGIIMFAVYTLSYFASAQVVAAGIDGAEAGMSKMMWIGVITGIIAYILAISMIHFTVISLRNKTSFYPAKPIVSTLKYLLTLFGLIIGGVVAILVAFIPMLLLPYLGMNLEEGSGQIVLMVWTAIVALVVAANLIRLCFRLTAFTVNDILTLKETWRMTKGYTIKILILFIVVLLPSGLVALLSPQQAPDPTTQLMAQPSLALFILTTIVSVLSAIMLNVSFGVLYEEFRLRAIPEAPVDADYGQCQN